MFLINLLRYFLNSLLFFPLRMVNIPPGTVSTVNSEKAVFKKKQQKYSTILVSHRSCFLFCIRTTFHNKYPSILLLCYRCFYAFCLHSSQLNQAFIFSAANRISIPQVSDQLHKLFVASVHCNQNPFNWHIHLFLWTSEFPTLVSPLSVKFH